MTAYDCFHVLTETKKEIERETETEKRETEKEIETEIEKETETGMQKMRKMCMREKKWSVNCVRKKLHTKR